MSDQFVLCSILEFSDGSASVSLLGRGTLEECEQIAALIPGIVNKTGRQAADSYLGTMSAEEYDAWVLDEAAKMEGK